jgi:hypothetical protein
MKYFICCLLITFFSMELVARENPFEPTDTYNQKQKEYFTKIEEEEKAKQQEAETARMQEQLLMEREKELAELELQKEQELQKINELQEKRKILQDDTPKIILTPKKIVKNIKNYKVLPFVTIQTTDDTLMVIVDKKFRLINQDILKKQKKFLFDFKGHTSFYTIRKKLDHVNFKAYSVGTHKEKGFFRVVIDLPSETQNYKESVDTNEGIIKIQRL